MRSAITEQNHKNLSQTGSAKIVSFLFTNKPHSHSRALAAFLFPNILYLSFTFEKPAQLRQKPNQNKYGRRESSRTRSPSQRHWRDRRDYHERDTSTQQRGEDPNKHTKHTPIYVHICVHWHACFRCTAPSSRPSTSAHAPALERRSPSSTRPIHHRSPTHSCGECIFFFIPAST